MKTQQQCCRCGHLPQSKLADEDAFTVTPCNHLYCAKCIHRLFALQSRISCSNCGRIIFRHELTAYSGSKEDQLLQIISNTRKRVFAIMNKARLDFDDTPAYDDFQEMREDIISQFVELYDPSSVGGVPTMSREELEKTLHRFEVENQEQIIHSRNTAEERKRRKIEEIIEKEGTLYDRINVDFSERGSVIDHELAVQYADLLLKGTTGSNHHTSADLINRRTRLIQQASAGNGSNVSIPTVAHASGCADLWRERARASIIEAFS